MLTIANKNLLKNADFGKGESKSVTNFLETECNKCGNKIKFKLAIGNIKDVEEYIEKLEADNYEQNNIINSYIEERRELIEKLEKDKKELTEELKYNITKQEAKIQLKLINKYLEIFKE